MADPDHLLRTSSTTKGNTMTKQTTTTTEHTHLDELIAAERKRANERIAKLKRAAAAEQRKVDAKVVDLLRDQEPDLYGRLAREAGDTLVAEKAKRSKRAKASAEPTDPVPGEAAAQADGRPHDEGAQWNR